ncbi:MAG: hypothetical protein ABSG51_02335 [Terracidiphilus sp.]
MRELISVLDKQLLSVLESRSVLEFKEARAKMWPKYIRALRALSDTMSNLVSDEQMDAQAGRIFAELTADFEKQRGARFGGTLVDQAIFSLWTLGKIRSLGSRICAVGRPDAKKRRADVELHSEFRACSLWSQFHLDCAIAAMKFRKNVPVDVQSEICDGLRALVNAYATMKEALSLRLTNLQGGPFSELPWDEEDDRLLAASMRDMNGVSDTSGS